MSVIWYYISFGVKRKKRKLDAVITSVTISGHCGVVTIPFDWYSNHQINQNQINMSIDHTNLQQRQLILKGNANQEVMPEFVN